MSPSASLPAVEHRIVVRLKPPAAFELYTAGMRRWWPFRGHSCSGDDALDVEFEPRVGGAVTEVSRRGERWTWGTLTAWDPPRGFAMSWHPGLDEAEATLLRVTFKAVPAGTEVHVHHSGWEARGEAAASKRDQYDGGWPLTLHAFAAVAEKEQP